MTSPTGRRPTDPWYCHSAKAWVPGRPPPATVREDLEFVVNMDLSKIEARILAGLENKDLVQQRIREVIDAYQTPDERRRRKRAIFARLYSEQPEPENTMSDQAFHDFERTVADAVRDLGNSRQERPIWRTGEPCPAPEAICSAVSEHAARPVDYVSPAQIKIRSEYFADTVGETSNPASFGLPDVEEFTRIVFSIKDAGRQTAYAKAMRLADLYTAAITRMDKDQNPVIQRYLERIENLRTDLESADKQVTERDRQVSAIMETMQVTSDQRDDASRECDALRQEQAHGMYCPPLSQDTLDGMEHESILDAIFPLGNSSNDAVRIKRRLRVIRAEARGTIENLKSELKQSRTNESIAREDRRINMQRADDYMNELARVNPKLAEAERLLTEYRKELSATTDARDLARNECSSAERNVQRMEADVEQARSNEKRANDRVIELTTRNGRLVNSVAHEERKLDCLQSNYDAVCARGEELESANLAFATREQELQATVKTLTSELAHANTMLDITMGSEKTAEDPADPGAQKAEDSMS